MNDWPPPSVDDAPQAPAGELPVAAGATPWWQQSVARVLLVAWVIGGIVVLAAVLTSTARSADPELVDSVPTPIEPGSTSPPATTPTAGADPGNGSTTTSSAPQVRSAPPVPPVGDPTAAPTLPTVPPATTTTTTTIVVTLPTTTTAPTLPDAPRIDITTQFDAAGDDTANLNDEWVRFTNAGTQLVDMTDWLVRDDGLLHAHVFEPLILGPGAAVTLYSGCGEATPSERYFCTSDPEVWNNAGDIVSLFDERGRLIAQRSG